MEYQDTEDTIGRHKGNHRIPLGRQNLWDCSPGFIALSVEMRLDLSLYKSAKP